MTKDYFYILLRSSVRAVLPLEHVKEVFMLSQREICPIPGVTPALLGVINQHGQLLWVLELSDLLNLAWTKRKITVQDSLTAVWMTTSQVGASTLAITAQLALVVVALHGIVSLDSASFKPVPARLSPTVKRFISGVAEIERLRVAILNVNAIFAALQNEKAADYLRNL